MKLSTSIILLTAIIASCTTDNRLKTINWNATNTLPADDDQPHIGIAGPVAGTIGNKLIIAGGANFPDKMPWDGGHKHYTPQAFIYQIDSDKLVFLDQQRLTEAVAYSGTCSTGLAIYFAGGENAQGPISSTKRLTLVQQQIVEDILPDLPQALTNGGLVFVGETLYFVGGENEQMVSDKIYALDLSSDNTEWKEVYTLPYPVSNAVVLSNSKDKLYIIGGRMRNPNSLSTIYDQLLEVNLTNKVVDKIADLPHPSAAGTGIIDKDGNILLFGGDHAETFHQVEALIAQINQASNEADKEILDQKKAKLQRAHPGFTKTTWSFDTIEKRWSILDDIVGESPVTTTASLYDDIIIIPSGEIRAGVRTDQILLGRISKK